MADDEKKETLEMQIALVQTDLVLDFSFTRLYTILEYHGRDLNDSEKMAVLVGGDRLMINGVGVYTKTTDFVSSAFCFPDGTVGFCRRGVDDKARPVAIRHLVYTLE